MLLASDCRRAREPGRDPWQVRLRALDVVIGAMAFAASSEWNNVHGAGNRGYAASMPMISGIGLAPMLQWLIVPPAIVGGERFSAPVPFR